MGQEGAEARTLGNFYRAVVQDIIIFRSENWVIYPHIRSNLVGFNKHVIHIMKGHKPRR